MHLSTLQSREKEIKSGVEKEDWKGGMWNERKDVKERSET